MKTTLLITTYNWPEALRLVLHSVKLMRRLPDEIVIGDDGSTDDTRKMIERVAKDFPVPIVHVWQEDRGFRRTAILNKAIARATGDYIIQVDGDVLLNPHFVEDHIEVAQPGCFVCGSRVKLDAKLTKKIFDTSRVKLNFWNLPIGYMCNSFRSHVLRYLLAFRYGKRIDHLRGCNMAFWKSDLIKVNGYDENLESWGHEDAEIAYRLHNAGVRKKCLKMGGIVYHLYHKEASKANEQLHDKAIERVRAEHLCRCQNGLDKYLGTA